MLSNDEIVRKIETCYNNFEVIGMFEWLKKRFKKETEPLVPEKEPVLVCIHGFGVRRSVEFDQFKQFAEMTLPKIITFDMFDIQNEEDQDPKRWLKRAMKQMDEIVKEHDEIYLLGFSMGGVIASYLATLYPIKKLVLISPAFIHFSLENYTNIVINEASKLVFKEKKSEGISMPKSFYNGFLEIVKEHKNSIAQVKCPILLLQGDDDEVIPTKSSEWAYEQIKHNQKRLAFLHKGKHRVLDDEHVKDMAYLLIQDFILDKLLPIEKSSTEDNESLNLNKTHK